MPNSSAAGPKGTGGKSPPDYQGMAERRGESPAFLTCDGIRIPIPPMDKAPSMVKVPPMPHPPVTHPSGSMVPFKVPPTPSNPNPPPSPLCEVKAPPRIAPSNVPAPQPVPIPAAPKVSHWPPLDQPLSVSQQRKIRHGQDPYKRRHEREYSSSRTVMRGRSPARGITPHASVNMVPSRFLGSSPPPQAKKPPPCPPPEALAVANTPLVLERLPPTDKYLRVDVSDSDDDEPMKVQFMRPTSKAMPAGKPNVAPPSLDKDSSNDESDASDISLDNPVMTAILTMEKLSVKVRLQTFVPMHQEYDISQTFAATVIDMAPSTKAEPSVEELEISTDFHVLSMALAEFSLEPGYVFQNKNQFRPADLTEFSRLVFWYVRYHRQELPWSGELGHRIRNEDKPNVREDNSGMFPHLNSLSRALSFKLRHQPEARNCGGYLSLAELINMSRSDRWLNTYMCADPRILALLVLCMKKLRF